uniref:Uncharacterized protein n=1 Tax=Anguilla anguilla TaxID=7936 RepID=A0A0E9P7I4_ANGAN
MSQLVMVANFFVTWDLVVFFVLTNCLWYLFEWIFVHNLLLI